MLKIKRLLLLLLVFIAFFATETIFAQKINQFNKEGKRIGFWKKYYKNGRLRYTGQFENGKEVGTFMYFDMTSSDFPSIIKIFEENSDVAMVEYYTPKGKITSRGEMKGKDRIGKWTYYFPNKKVLSVEHYLDGKLSGKLINYYPNGKITEETEYKDGKKNGLSKKYADTGVLIEEVNFKDNKQHGLAKYFTLKGDLQETGNYEKGVRVGRWEFFIDGEAVDSKKKYQRKTHSIPKN